MPARRSDPKRKRPAKSRAGARARPPVKRKAGAAAAKKTPAKKKAPVAGKKAAPAKKKAARATAQPFNAKAATKALERVEQALKSPNPPGVFSYDEFLWVVACVRDFALRLKGVPSPDDVQAVIDRALDPELRRGATARLASFAKEKGLSRAEAASRADVLAAWTADPVRVTAAVFCEQEPTCFQRGEDEAVHYPSNPEDGALEAWAEWASHLESLGDKIAAARVRRTASLLRERG